MDEDQIAEQILEMLSGSKFEQWYSHTYLDFIEGDESAESREHILNDIKRMMKMS